MVTRNGETVLKHGPSTQKSQRFLKIYRTNQITGNHFRKTMVALKGTNYLEVILKRLTWFKLQRAGPGNGSANIMDTLTERFQLHMFKTCPGKIQRQSTWCEDSNKNIETSSKSMLKLIDLNDIYIKSTKKLVKDEIYT